MSDDASRKIELLRAARRAHALGDARERMLPFMQLLMPDPQDLGDVTKSRYQITPLARILCEVMEKVDRGELKRVAISVGPQLGKSQIVSRAAPAWMTGRNPYLNTMLGTYNQDFANDFGEDVRDIAKSAIFQQVFPGFELKSQSVGHQVTREGGQLNFIGVGGSGTGKPADRFIVDDPIRSDDDAQSASYRNRIWKWFNSVVFTRCHDDTAVVIVHTRWHQDDLIGRLCDPNHPERNKAYKGIAENWTYINLPAVVEDPKLADALGLTLTVPDGATRGGAAVLEQFGDKPMSSLWPGRKSLPFLAEARRQDPRVFGALYMGQPTPEDGDYFKNQWLAEYERDELPSNLRMYGASDHAVSTKQRADSTVVGCVGIDEHDDIWIMPDVVWRQMETDSTVEEIMGQLRTHKPLLWWMESELISKSFGPFLRQRMQEAKLYCTIDGVTPSRDKMTRARSIQGRMQMRKVHFPRFASWWPDAKGQLLKFPFGTHDDFVDWLAHIGMGLQKQIPAERDVANDRVGPPVGSMQWIMNSALTRVSAEKRASANKGW